MFVNNGGNVSLVFGEVAFDWGKPFLDVVTETRAGETKVLKHGEALPHVGGSVLPLYVGYKPTGATPEVTASPKVNAVGVSSSEINLSWDYTQAEFDNVGAFVIYRDGKLLGSIASRSFTDAGLAEASKHTYSVSAVSRAGVESAKTDVGEVATLADVIAPRLITASSLNYPPHVIATFSEKLDPTTTNNVANYTILGHSITAAKLRPDEKSVELLTAALVPGDAVLKVSGITDCAVTPNVIKPAESAIAAAPHDETIYEQNFDAAEVGSVPPNFGDNSEWKGTTVQMSVIKDGANGKAELKNDRFGQVILFRAPGFIEKSATYVVSADITSSTPNPEEAAGPASKTHARPPMAAGIACADRRPLDLHAGAVPARRPHLQGQRPHVRRGLIRCGHAAA